MTTSSDYTARLWDVKTGKEIRSLPGLGGGYGHVDISPDSKRILHFAGSDQFAYIVVRNLDNGEELLKLRGHERGISSARFSPDGKRIVSTSHDQTVRFGSSSGEPMAVFKGHEGQVLTARFNPDGHMVVSGGDDATARIWNIASGRDSSTLPVPKVSVAVFALSADGQRLAALARPPLVTSVWNIDTGKEIRFPSTPLTERSAPTAAGS